MIRRVPSLLVACLLGACLNRENVGEFNSDEHECPDLTQATAADGEACITDFIDDISTGRWIGKGTSGAQSVYCLVEFARDGSIRLALAGENLGRADVERFGNLFLTRGTPEVEGRYVINDLLDGEFFGTVERPTDTGTFRNDLEHMVLTGDELTFVWRLGSDVSPTTTRLMLMRDR